MNQKSNPYDITHSRWVCLPLHQRGGHVTIYYMSVCRCVMNDQSYFRLGVQGWLLVYNKTPEIVLNLLLFLFLTISRHIICFISYKNMI